MGLAGKTLVELMKQKGDPNKKYSATTMLTGEELDLAYEIVTKEHSVENFDEFLSQARRMEVSAVSMEEVEAAAKHKKTAVNAAETPSEPNPASDKVTVRSTVKQPSQEHTDEKKAKKAEVKPAGAEKTEKPVKVEKAEKAVKVEKAEKTEKPEKMVKVEKVEKTEKTEKPVKVEKVEKTEKTEKPVKVEKVEKTEAKPAAVKVPAAPVPQRGAAVVIGQIQIRPQQPQRKSGGDRRKDQSASQPKDNRDRRGASQEDRRRTDRDRQNGSRPLGQNGQASAPARNGSVESKPVTPRQPAVKAPVKAATNKPIDPKFQQPVKQKNPSQQPRRVEPPTTRIVDTRTTELNADKYNTRYDDMAVEKQGRRGDSPAGKQKIHQKSQDYRKKKGGAKKETEAERMRRIEKERKSKPITITVPDEITVGELALRLKVTASEVIKKLMLMGTMVTINDVIDFDTAYLVAEECHAKVEKEVVVTIEDRIIDDSEDTDETLVPRSPVVAVLGHVDHGKTSLLDAIRTTHVTETEAGGITQHIGAYRVKVADREITFLDTPGHEAFTSMRARGAQATDIAILVVAADDGIMPQTVEAINHAKAANVQIIVAINKMDKPGANPDAIKQQLTEYELVPEEWGGDVMCVPVSAKTREGLDDLLEGILLVADVMELRANPDRAAKGIVIEARLDKGRGPIATVLVQNGTLRVGDIIVAGTAVGRVRAMINDKGERVETAGPSIPVEITGLDEAPTGGDIFDSVSDERLARELVEQRKQKIKDEIFKQRTQVTLDNLFSQMQEGEMKELKIIIKADVQGSVEAVRQSLVKLSNEEVRVNVIHGAVGAISESDVMLADASQAIIVGFNVRPDPVAEEYAKRQGVDMRLYRIIYDCIEEIQDAMKGMLAPKTRVVELGKAEIRMVYKITNVGIVAGCYVTHGKIPRNAQIRVVRDGIVLAEDKIASLKRFKDDQKEVAEGYECGITLERYSDIKEGDMLEAFTIEEYRD
ncbi:MAG: translation initiation factor IF-2 [Clostridia bacterium]|nr:translation initiation factor IF-2 [Clostridia bacterium]